MASHTKLLKIFNTFSVILTITLILFLMVNIGASIYLETILNDKSKKNLFLDKHGDEAIKIKKKAFNTENEALLKEYENAPGIRPHTVLHFSEGTSRPHYKVGIEGVRYLSNWTDETVKKSLQEKNKVTFVFGGSTTFGDGVPNDNTLVAYLNSLDSQSMYLNFGVQAYDSIREVDKLLYLLRKGYRPKTVIFIDGLNDITTFAGSPYEIHDTPRTQGLVLDRGQVPLIFGWPTSENMRLAFAYSLPVSHLAYRLLNDDKNAINVFTRKSADLHGLNNWVELMNFQDNWTQIQKNKTKQLSNDIVRYYKENISFIQQLGKSFDFKAYFIYQPIGLLDKSNPFLKKDYFNSDIHMVFKGVDSGIRSAIMDGSLNIKDCSDSFSKSKTGFEAYIDPTHYSPYGNKNLASCIHKNMLGPSLTFQHKPFPESSDASASVQN
jgi:hypothetical protein